MRIRIVMILALLCAVILPAAVIAQDASPTPVAATAEPVVSVDCQVGRQPDGSIVLPTNQILTPTGTQIEFPGRPVDVAVNPDGATAAVLTNPNSESNAPKGTVVVIDLVSGDVLQTFDPGAASSSFAGILFSADGSELYVSDYRGFVHIAEVATDGSLTLQESVELDAGDDEVSRAGGLALSEDGDTLYVALNLKNAVAVVDLDHRTVTDEIATGNAPFEVVVAGDKAYVSNQGGRLPEDGDFTNQSGGAEIVADPETGMASTGTISVLDLTTNSAIGSIEVGLQPTAMLLNGPDLFVTNANSDTISVIDTETDEVMKTVAIQVFPGAPFGSSPNGLALVGDKLLVSLGRNNAIALYDWEGADQATKFEGLIPTGWYPGAIALDPSGESLVVANTKGAGSLGPETDEAGPEAENPTGLWVHQNVGSASIIPIDAFDVEQIAGHTAQVYENNQWSTAACAGGAPAAVQTGTEVAPVALPARIGDPSTIKHVFYIIKENRTYDQVLGDMSQGNGDPSLVQFGADVTPNQHALAEQFQLMDNLYVSGSLSADGHQWVTQSFVVDYIEKAFGDFARAYPFNGRDALAYAPSGFIWDNAIANGLTVRNYGEYCNQFTDEEDPFGSNFGPWESWYADYQALQSGSTADLTYPIGQYQTHSDVPSLDAVTNRDFPPYSTNIPDVYRAEIFLQEFEQFVENGDLPNLVTMLLPADHTSGTAPDFPTPDAQVADNDLALGRVIEAISQSPYWEESAIFVIEDDAQNGVDHVDGHRTTGFVISPWVNRGIVSSTYYTQIDMIRTIEQILGLPPMNQMDLAATPMWELFTDTPDLTPFTAIEPTQAIDEMNPPAASLPPIAQAWSEVSAEMGFAEYDDIAAGPDSKDQNLLNHAIWYGTMGYDIPYPGEAEVLWPHEVTPATESEEDELEELVEQGNQPTDS